MAHQPKIQCAGSSDGPCAREALRYDGTAASAWPAKATRAVNPCELARPCRSFSKAHFCASVSLLAVLVPGNAPCLSP